MEEEAAPSPPLTQERFDAADTICRPFFRLLYEDTSLEFEAALDRVVHSRKRLLFYKYKTYRIVLYIIDHTLPLQARYGDYKGSALADMFRPERPFNPDDVSETTRFSHDDANENGEGKAKSIVWLQRNNVRSVVNITGVLTKELDTHYTQLYAKLSKGNGTNVLVDRSRISTMNRGQFVTMQMQSAQRKRRQKEKEEGVGERKVNPWENESVWIAMQHAATEVQIRASDTKTAVSPMHVFHLLCASMIEETQFQDNLNVWFNQILPHIIEIDANIREKFQDSTSVLAQAIEDVNFVLCMLSYLSKFELDAKPFADFESIFYLFNAQADGKFEMLLYSDSIGPFIVAAAQSVGRNFIVLSDADSLHLVVLNKASPKQHAVPPSKPYCVGANNCHTIFYPNIAMFSFDSSIIKSIHEVKGTIFPELFREMEMLSPNKKNQRACEMASIQTGVHRFGVGNGTAPSLWCDLEYYLAWLPKVCNADLVSAIVGTVQGIPYQVVKELLKAPKVFLPQEEGGFEEEEKEFEKTDEEDIKKRNNAIQNIAKSYLYSNTQKKQEEARRLDPFLNENKEGFLFLTQSDEGDKAHGLPELEEAVALLQIS